MRLSLRVFSGGKGLETKKYSCSDRARQYYLTIVVRLSMERIYKLTDLLGCTDLSGLQLIFIRKDVARSCE